MFPLLDICFEQMSNIYQCVIFIKEKLSNLNVQKYKNG